MPRELRGYSQAKDKKAKAFDTPQHSYVQNRVGYSMEQLVKQLQADPRTAQAIKSKQVKESKAMAMRLLGEGKCYKQPQYYTDAELTTMATNTMEAIKVIEEMKAKHAEEKMRASAVALRATERERLKEEVRRELSGDASLTQQKS